MEENKKGELEEQNLEEVTGGHYVSSNIQRQFYAVRWDSRGNETHWEWSVDGVAKPPYHYVCPNCGKLLHEGMLGRLYCDPCDESWFDFTLEIKGYKREGIYPGC